MWSGPRNISTAIMYSFAQRPDTVIYDEPLYGFYLKNSKAKEYHPGALEVMQTMDLDGNQVVKNMLAEHSQPVAFFKQMTHHLLDLDKGFMKEMEHIILTREPENMLPSFAKEIENPTISDVGYKDHLELLTYLKSINKRPLVVDSKVLLDNPKDILMRICDFLEIPFYPEMLKWESGPRQEDGIWAKFWYKSVHESTGFIAPKKKKVDMPENLLPLLKESRKYYDELIQYSI